MGWRRTIIEKSFDAEWTNPHSRITFSKKAVLLEDAIQLLLKMEEEYTEDAANRKAAEDFKESQLTSSINHG